MSVKDAIAVRINAILCERDPGNGITLFSVYCEALSVNLVKNLCDGLDISLGEMFSEPVFDELEREIQSWKTAGDQ